LECAESAVRVAGTRRQLRVSLREVRHCGHSEVSVEKTVPGECTLCGNCTVNCPAQINWQNIARVMRERYNKEGKNTSHNLKMAEHIRQFGNPFGEVNPDQTPTELFCC